MSFETDSNRIFGLDLVRAFAIILVVLVHGSFMLTGTALDGFPYFKMIDGVDIFFVLSGFLIGGILLKEINRPKGFKKNELFRFWKRRWFRTLPNYYLVLLLNYIVVKYGIINEDIEQFSFHFITFTQNFKTPFYRFFWESWSLSIEEWFYIITPITILFLLKLLKPKQAFLASTILIIILPILYRITIFDANIDHFWWDVTFRKTILCRLDSIGYGLLISWTYYYYSKYWLRYKFQSFTLGAILLVFILNTNLASNPIYKQIIYFSIIPISVMLCVPLAHSYKRSKGVIAIAIQHISKISYSMYLINLALVAEVIRDNFTPEGGIDGIMKYLIYWTIVIGVSTLMYKFYEKPMMDLRDKKFLFFSGKKSD